MKTLVLNCGSSSLKFQLIDTTTNEVLAKGLVEKIGAKDAILNYKSFNNASVKETMEIKDHDYALKLTLNLLTDSNKGVLKDISEIGSVGHRVVHGGEQFVSSVLIDQSVLKSIKECSTFAPLHNPANIKGIEACSQIIKGIKQVAVFDTAFHQQIPKHAYLYALPYAFYEKFGIRRYGFHGTSHWYVSKQAANILGKDYNDFKVITCHLGNGSSMSAIKNGVSLDTTMGFTPLEGLMMGTRCGDIDPAIIPYIMQKENITPQQIANIMNKQSGLKGISITSSDMREIENQMEMGSELHQLAHDMFCYRIKKYIGSYLAILNGIDALVFTGGIGENSYEVRQKVCQDLDFFGISLVNDKNNKNETLISNGKTSVMVVPTNEELAIAQETARILQN